MWFSLLFIVCLQEHASFAFQPSSINTSLRIRPFKTLTHFENIQKNCHFRAHSDDKLESEAGDQSNNNVAGESAKSTLQDALEGFSLGLLRKDGFKKLPPLRFEDLDLLFYDVFLVVNLSLSISFWVTHRVDFSFLPSALNEGCIFSLFWILSGMCFGFSQSFSYEISSLTIYRRSLSWCFLDVGCRWALWFVRRSRRTQSCGCSWTEYIHWCCQYETCICASICCTAPSRGWCKRN